MESLAAFSINDAAVMFSAVLFKLFVAIIAFAGVRLSIHNMDKAFGINIHGWTNTASDMAKAVYFGLRLVAVCILFGYIFS